VSDRISKRILRKKEGGGRKLRRGKDYRGGCSEVIYFGSESSGENGAITELPEAGYLVGKSKTV